MRSMLTLVPQTRSAVVGAECECGRAKSPAAHGCERCLWFDGQDRAEGVLIATFRSLSGAASLQDLTFEARLSYRQVLRGVKRLMQRGRLRKRVEGVVAEYGSNTGHRTPATYELVDPDLVALAA